MRNAHNNRLHGDLFFCRSAAPNRRVSRALYLFKMPLHIHAVVENSNHNDLRFRANSVKDGVATLAKLLISWPEVIGIAANFRLTSKQVKGIVKLLKVFVALSLFPLFGSKAANVNNVA